MKVAFLTAGGVAPCLTSSIISIIRHYNNNGTNHQFIGYLNGYKGLLLGNSMNIPNKIYSKENQINQFGGSFLGNSRVKLSNVDDCIRNNYISDGQLPVEVAANQLVKDNIDILHTIGGDDTNTTAYELVSYLEKHNYNLTVVGLPKTIDNDISPINQTLGAFTAAEKSAEFFKNIVNENTTSTRQLIIHEVMGRNCGWLTAYSAYIYMNRLEKEIFIPEIKLIKDKWKIHGIFLPERKFDLRQESERLKKCMDEFDCVNIFLSEGAGIDNIISEKKSKGENIPRDAFGHIRLDEINPGQWFANYFKHTLDCDKVLVQKSGYYARSSKPNANDLVLINKHAKYAVECAIEKKSGVIGIDEQNNKLQCINFDRIVGGKKFDINLDWFIDLINRIEI